MSEPDDWLHLTLGTVIVVAALVKLSLARGKPAGYRSIWLALTLIGSTEIIGNGPLYRGADATLGPGWGMIFTHAVGMVGVGFGINAMYLIVRRDAAARARNVALTAAAVLVCSAPWIIAAPPAVPSGAAQPAVYYAATWQSTVHWSAFTLFLINRVYVHLRITWHRVVVLREEGSLATGVRIMCLADVLIIAAVAEALALQGAWLLGKQERWNALMHRDNGGAGALAVALLALSVGWPYLRQRWQHLTAHRAWSPARSRLRLLHEHWAWLTEQVPEVALFPEAVTGHPTSAENMQWQRTRIVTEVYDVHRRLEPYYDHGDHQRALDEVGAHRLPRAGARAAAERVCLLSALARYRAGQPAAHTRAEPTTPSRTAESTANAIARSLRLIRAPRTAAAIRAATTEEPWTLSR